MTVISTWAVGMDVLITKASTHLRSSVLVWKSWGEWSLCIGKPPGLGLEYVVGSNLSCAHSSGWEIDSQALWDPCQWWMYRQVGEEAVMSSSGGSAQVSSWGREEAWCGRYLLVWWWETKVEIFVSELLSWHAGKHQSVLSTLLTGKYCYFQDIYR